MTEQTKMAWEEQYEDGSGIQYAVRFDGLADSGKGEIELQAFDKITFPSDRIGWLIECLERIRGEQGI